MALVWATWEISGCNFEEKEGKDIEEKYGRISFHMGGASFILQSISISLFLFSFLSISNDISSLRRKCGGVEKERLSYAGYACTFCDHVMYNLSK